MAGNTFQVKILGLDRMLKALQKAPDLIEPVMQEAIAKSNAILAANTTRDTVPWVTGTLASFRWEMGRLYGRWYPWVDYAKAVQFGMPASPGRYVPAIKARLVDDSKRDIGMWPGFKGRHYMERIMAESKAPLADLFKNALDVITQKLAKE